MRTTRPSESEALTAFIVDRKDERKKLREIVEDIKEEFGLTISVQAVQARFKQHLIDTAKVTQKSIDLYRGVELKEALKIRLALWDLHDKPDSNEATRIQALGGLLKVCQWIADFQRLMPDTSVPVKSDDDSAFEDREFSQVVDFMGEELEKRGLQIIPIKGSDKITKEVSCEDVTDSK